MALIQHLISSQIPCDSPVLSPIALVQCLKNSLSVHFWPIRLSFSAHRYHCEAAIKRVNSSDVSEPRLGLARFWLELLKKKLGSARYVFEKARFLKNAQNEPKINMKHLYFRLLEWSFHLIDKYL